MMDVFFEQIFGIVLSDVKVSPISYRRILTMTPPLQQTICVLIILQVPEVADG